MDRAPETAVPAPDRRACVRLDLAGFITEWPASAQAFFGFEAQQAIGQHLLFLSLHSEDEDWLDLGAAGAGHPGDATASLTVFCRTQAGPAAKARLQLQLECDPQGSPSALNAHFEPLNLELTPDERQPLYRHLLENSNLPALLTDPKGRIVWLNRAFVALTGHPQHQALGHNLDWLCAADSETVRSQLQETLHTHRHWRGRLALRCPDGQMLAQTVRILPVRDDQGHSHHALLLCTPTQEQPPPGVPAAFDAAHLDPVTRLPNRLLLAQLLTPALAQAKRGGWHTAVLVLQLQRLEWVYDTLGHDCGDEGLLQLVQRVQTGLREQDLLARFGHDKLALVLLGVQQPDHAALVAHKLLALLSAPITLQGHSVQLSACVGIALYPDNGLDAATLLRNAQSACQRAATGHEGAVQFFSEEMTHRATERFELESDLRRAIAHGELLLHHQPKVSLRNGLIVGAEALLRWQHPRHGLLTPARFVALAEETHLILELGEWVLNEACSQIAGWRAAGLQMPPLAVNLSVRQIDRHLPRRIEHLLQQHRVAPQQLKLELTESLMARNPDDMLRIMNELAAMGLGLALDDFGTGYSSLSYLKRLPISTLKIDRAFVTGVPLQANDCAIAQAIITMGRQLRHEIVAEGVETRAQMEYLRGLGCDQLQGYLFSRPLPEAEYARLVQTGARLAL
ncbi:MAG: EAL domain-containing protein [Pseudomonadota bacterium]|jgi:diguanylate cyclase (GGDEF)-like protein/PAS domain S-box-containing protein